MRSALALACLFSLSACASNGTSKRPHEPAIAAIQAIRASDFEGALREADAMRWRDPEHPEANAIAALVHYRAAMERLAADLVSAVMPVVAGLPVNQRYLISTLDDSTRALDAVDAELARASADGRFSLELCVACWEVDWNLSGGIDARDRQLLEIEVDAAGQAIPEGDPRRRPTFHFDRADLDWARAMLAFQRASIALIAAYDWSEVGRLVRGGDGETITIRVRDAKRLARAKALILEGIDRSLKCREGYLAETDDDREWVPNPKQQNHPLPLPVDAALYETWGAILADVRKLIEGEEGIALEELAALLPGEELLGGAAQSGGFIDLSKLFSPEAEWSISSADREALGGMIARLRVPSMKPTRLLTRLLRIRREIEVGEETLGRKLRYLLWLN